VKDSTVIRYNRNKKKRVSYDIFLKTTWRHQRSCCSHRFNKVQNWLNVRLYELRSNVLLKKKKKVQIHSIFLILNLYIFELFMAICSQKKIIIKISNNVWHKLSQLPATCLYPEPARSTPYSHIPQTKNIFTKLYKCFAFSLSLRSIIMFPSYAVDTLRFDKYRNFYRSPLVYLSSRIARLERKVETPYVKMHCFIVKPGGAYSNCCALEG
jgi:hypothetical protein